MWILYSPGLFLDVQAESKCGFALDGKWKNQRRCRLPLSAFPEKSAERKEDVAQS